MTFVLILGNPSDPHAKHVYHELLARDVKTDFWNTLDFPGQMNLSLNPKSGHGELTLYSGTKVSFDEITSVYWRNFMGTDNTAGREYPEHAWIAQNDTRSLLESFLMDMPCRWVNGWEGFQLHQRKPAALMRVAQLGYQVPETILTNDAEDVRSFFAQHGSAIFKPIQGGAHTKRLDQSFLTDENLESLKISPVTIQEEIKGTNVRVFVFGDQAVGCEIQAEEIDFRDNQQAKIVPLELDSSIVKQSVEIAKLLQLEWSGIDYRVTPEGEYYFLEANPSPMFIGFETRSGLPLTQYLLDLLVKKDP